MLEQVEGVMTGKRLQAILTAGGKSGERDGLAQELGMTTVLVVHRDRGDVAWLNDYLEKAGFRVVTAGDGRAGLDLARRESPELILLSLTPPAPAERSDRDASRLRMDGCEFLTRMRTRDEWRGVPVIVLSAKDLSEEERRILSERVEQVVKKEAGSNEQVVKLIHRVLDRAPAVEPQE